MTLKDFCGVLHGYGFEFATDGQGEDLYLAYLDDDDTARLAYQLLGRDAEYWCLVMLHVTGCGDVMVDFAGRVPGLGRCVWFDLLPGFDVAAVEHELSCYRDVLIL